MTNLARIAYVGMTHLGICSAIAAASKGFSTIGFSPEEDLVARLGAGQLPVVEPELDALLRDHRERITFTSDPATLGDCDVIYVAPDIPTDHTGRSDLSPLNVLLDLARKHSRPDAVIVILSQVAPGYTRARAQQGRLLFYQVETLIFGRAVERATKPERFIVGCLDPHQPLPPALARYLEAFGCPILPMRFESAELAKIAINCCLVASVATANTLAGICENIGADWSEIVPALRLDRRIGPYSYLAPGLGISGGNLERDLATMVELGDAHGTDVGVVRAWQANSRFRRDWVLRKLHELVLPAVTDAKLALLGLAYKENTHSTKNSPALALLADVAPFAVTAYDPVVAVNGDWHPRLSGAIDALAAVADADALIIMTPWPQFKDLKPADVAGRLRGKIVIDPFACLDRAACYAAGLSHHTLGV
ncbi:MAG: UDP-glucose/GDP-mannose dehydrogenase [Xanthobacteraceae bacterium]|nr:UDP-glucose/GDP-mannose dehydrogenase [Xanthobacteraceae bacterium]